MVVAPHEGGAANEVVRQPHQLVHPSLGRHCPMVAAVLHREANPCACQTCREGDSLSLRVRAATSRLSRRYGHSCQYGTGMYQTYL